MKFAGIVLAFCVIAAFAEEEIKTEDEVLVITKANFEEALEKYSYILFEFCKYTFFIFLCYLFIT